MDSTDDGMDFGAYLSTVSDLACVAHGIALGDNLGLFDLIVSLNKPANTKQISEAGNLKERYIREWLALMVCGKIIDYDPTGMTYSIPEHRIPFLTKRGKEKNMAVFMRGIPVLTAVSQELESCFKSNGPSEHGIEVCDAGCSTGYHAITIAKHFPESRFLAFDIDSDSIEIANKEAKQQSVSNVTCVVQDGCSMPSAWSGKYDLLFAWDTVHDIPYCQKFLKEVLRVLKPGGMFFMIDINVQTELGDNIGTSRATTYYGHSLFHCMTVSLSNEGGDGLGTAWGIQKQVQYLKEAGFVKIRRIHPADQSHSYHICNKEEEC